MLKKRNFSLVIISIYIFISLLSLVFSSPYFIIAGLLFIVGCAVIKDNFTSVIVFIILITFQNFFLIVFSSSFDSTSANIVKLCKELVIYGCLFFSIFVYKRRDKRLSIFCIILLWLLLLAVIPGEHISVKIAALRNILIPIVCFSTGALLRVSKNDLKKIYKCLIFCGLILSLCGLVLYFCSDNIWYTLGIKQFYINNGVTGSGQIVHFVTYDFGRALKRFTSITADPLATSHVLSLCFFVILLGNFKSQYKLLLPLFFICLLLGASKGFFLMCFVTFILVVYTRIHNKHIRRSFMIVMLLMFMAAMAYLLRYTGNITQATSTAIHFSSVISAIDDMSLLGNGLGSAGYSAYLANAAVNAEYNESFFASLLIQTGIVGIVAYYLPWGIVVTKSIRKYIKTKEKDALIISVIISSVMLESLFSSSAITMQGSAIFFILAGIIFSSDLFKKEELFKHDFK